MTLSAHVPALARKYRSLHSLRVARQRDGAAPDHARLRALATEFPGALRELDALPMEELLARASALEAVGLGAAVEPWMTAMAGYHALMRAALGIRRAGGDPAAVLAEVEALRSATGITLDELDLAAIARPPRGRLGVFVFGRLGATLGRQPDELWQAMFPTSRADRFAPRREPSE